MSDERQERQSLPVHMAVAAGILITAVVGATAGVVYRGKMGDEQAQAQQPANVSVESPFLRPAAEDLNSDTLPDMVLYLGGGRRVPLYGFGQLDGGSPAAYHPADFMRAQFPDSPVDYDSIEARLNR